MPPIWFRREGSWSPSAVSIASWTSHGIANSQAATPTAQQSSSRTRVRLAVITQKNNLAVFMFLLILLSKNCAHVFGYRKQVIMCLPIVVSQGAFDSTSLKNFVYVLG